MPARIRTASKTKSPIFGIGHAVGSTNVIGIITALPSDIAMVFRLVPLSKRFHFTSNLVSATAGKIGPVNDRSSQAQVYADKTLVL